LLVVMVLGVEQFFFPTGCFLSVFDILEQWSVEKWWWNHRRRPRTF
jgi:hypothetical protein